MCVKSKNWRSSGILESIGDDAAVLSWDLKKDLLVTTDMILEGRHFKMRESTAFEIGYKAMAVNLSDIAAMAGVPRFAVVSLGVPKKMTQDFLRRVYRGMISISSRFKTQIVGGDTNAADSLVVSVTLMGEVESGRAVLRSGAKVGDWVFVSGPLGGSYLSKKHLRFTPRIREARYLSAGYQVHAMMDLSDGLGSDIHRMTQESGVGALIDEDLIPLSPYAKNIQSALFDGEDFELLFTMPPQEGKRLEKSLPVQSMGKFIRVGEIVPKERGVKIINKNGTRITLKPRGFDHFK